jgi:hypothetical protein
MKPRKYYSLFLLAVGMLVLPLGLPAAADNPTETKPAVQAVSALLGQEYVDVLSGFSIRPLTGCELGGRQAPPDSSNAYPEAFRLQPPYWDILKVPPSKELVRFFDKKKELSIDVSLLVTRQKITIQNMLDARTAFWQSGGKASFAPGITEIIHDRPVAILEFTWPAVSPSQSGLIVREALIQHEQNRYFSILLTRPAPKPDEQQNSPLDWQAILNNFTCLNDADLQQRAAAARKNSQQLLAQMAAAAAADKTADLSWYRIIENGREVGFRRIARRPVQFQETPAQEFTTADILNNGTILPEYSRMMGLWLFASGDHNGDQPPVAETMAGPVSLLGRFVLKNDFTGGEFEVGFRDQQKPGNRKRCLGSWTAKALKITVFSDPQTPDQGVDETIEISDKIFLSWAQDMLMGRSIARQVGQEYFFVSYRNGDLGYYSVRVAGKSAWQPLEPPAPSGTAEKPAVNAIPAWYLIGRMDTDGTIVETWLDNDGQLLQKKHNGIVLIRSTPEAVQALWPQPFKDLNPDTQK